MSLDVAGMSAGGWMFLRLLFVLLMALNIAVGAWLLLGQPYVGIPHAADPGVRELRLLSEMPTPAVSDEPDPVPAAAASITTVPDAAASRLASAGAVSAASAPTVNASTLAPTSPLPSTAHAPAPPSPNHPSAAMSQTCLALGPFVTPNDLRSARQTLGAQLIRTRSRQDQVTQPGSWWVYLAATASHAQALELARQLSAHNIADYFVVSSGDQPNTVSLGVFKDPDNARKRRDEVVAAGFPARMIERTQAVPQYWLDLVARNTPRFDWRSHVRVAGVASRSITCF